MELNTNELRLIQPGGKEMREYAENTQGYYAAKGLHGPVPDESEKKILAETCAPEESTEMHFPGVIIAATNSRSDNRRNKERRCAWAYTPRRALPRRGCRVLPFQGKRGICGRSP